MKFEDAVKKSIKSFMNGKIPIATNELGEEGIFHTPDYFDELEENMLGEDKKKETADAEA
tara:strand:- start:833 stop:1012 length:180 start_codon:yes stop_codon:yes gene_type:complete